MKPGTAERILQVAIEAREADRPLTREEFDQVRAAGQAADTRSETRGALEAVGRDLTRQADARAERARVAEEQRLGAERQRQLDDRERRWRQLSPTAAALYNAIAERPSDPTLQTLAKHVLAPDRGKAPGTFEPDLIPEHLRYSGFPG